MKKNKMIIITIVAMIVLIIFYMLFDYNNVLTKKGIDIKRINIDIMDIFINSTIIIVLYVLTYFLVDKKNIETRENQEEIIKYMLINDYKSCLNFLNLLLDKRAIEHINSHIDGDAILYKNDFFTNYINIPFENYENINNYAIKGIVNKEFLEKYYYIKRSYKDVVTGIITFYNMNEEISKAIERGKQKLIICIEEEIKKIE